VNCKWCWSSIMDYIARIGSCPHRRYSTSSQLRDGFKILPSKKQLIGYLRIKFKDARLDCWAMVVFSAHSQCVTRTRDILSVS